VSSCDFRTDVFAISSTQSAQSDAARLDRETFAAFYEVALPRVFGYFLHRCGGLVTVAEDLTQDTFLAAVAELRRGRNVNEPLPWLFGIARHKLLDHYRRQARAERSLVGEPDAEPTATELDDDDEGPTARAVIALGEVAASQRAALVLRYMDGLSVPETAAALGKSIEAAESLLSRGRESFKRAYRGVPA
jgi:RNA polymerase sigma-70 factor, ECF subfamily